MKKNIVIAILLIISLMSIVYAFFQQTAANRAREQAEQNLVLAKQVQVEAQKQMELSRQETERANIEVQGALILAEAVGIEKNKLRAELEKCKGKK